MTSIKSKNEIMIMREGGNILAKVLLEVLRNVQPGISEIELDRLAEDLILKNKALPAFKRVKGYKHAICSSTNDVVVHGIPTNNKLRKGDLVGIDCGVYFKGFNTDMSETIKVKTQNSKVKSGDEVDRFLETGKRALGEAIKAARVGNRVGHISKTIQDTIEGSGYSVVRSLVGHGIGKDLHEEPEIPGFLDVAVEKTPKLLHGMTFAIEVIYNMGKPDVLLSKDN